MGIGTKAKSKFDALILDIEELLKLGRVGEGSGGPNRTRQQIGAMNSAGLIYLVTAFETFVESALLECVEHIATRSDRFENLAEPVRAKIVDYVAGSSEKTCGELADDGWRAVYIELAEKETRGSAFNTPKSENIDDIVFRLIGIEGMSKRWGWQNQASPGPANKLNELIKKRGAIVHGEIETTGNVKNEVDGYISTLSKIVQMMDEQFAEYCQSATGQALESM